MTNKHPLKPALLLLPNMLSKDAPNDLFFAPSIAKAVAGIDGLIAESNNFARRFLDRFDNKKKSTLEIPVALYNEHSDDKEIDFLLEPIEAGQRWGLIADAGLPCLADPGAKIVNRANEKGISVKAFAGPSSITLALMLSGLYAQKFTFNGYLDKSDAIKLKQIQKMAAQVKDDKTTQIFIEAPYRNQKLLQQLVDQLPVDVKLSVAWDLTMPTAGVATKLIHSWRKSSLPNIDKKPAVFLLGL